MGYLCVLVGSGTGQSSKVGHVSRRVYDIRHEGFAAYSRGRNQRAPIVCERAVVGNRLAWVFHLELVRVDEESRGLECWGPWLSYSALAAGHQDHVRLLCKIPTEPGRERAGSARSGLLARRAYPQSHRA